MNGNPLQRPEDVTRRTSAIDIELRDVRKTYGSVVAVDRVSLDIRQGEFFSLLGPSGCGKTTILRMVAGFVTPTSGEVRIRGKVVNSVPPHRRATNMVFQQLALFPHLNVFDNIAFGPRLKKLPIEEIRRRVTRVLEQVGLSGYEKRWTHELSGGQQQRVAIARAVINEPAALLLDEPLGALDLKLRVQMQLELKAMQKRLGTTFVYVTHDQSEAMLMSDRIAVIRDGKVEQLGSPHEIYSSPRTRFVAGFIGETNLITGTCRRVLADLIDVDVEGLTLRTRGSASVGQKVSVSVRPESISIGPDASHLDNHFAATVETATFLGPVIRYEIRVTRNWLLIAQEKSAAGQSYRAGERVDVGWSSSHSIVLQGAPA